MTDVIFLLAIVAAACAVPGPFLLLRRMALLSDAIGHVIIVGIVLTYFVVRDLGSPWLVVGAAAAGVALVAAVELLESGRRLKADAAIGLAFPALFAVGVILVSLYLRNTHLDADAVLTGNPEYAVEDRWISRGYDLGPVAAWRAGVMAIVNALFVTLFFKELKLTTFDPELAITLGYSPAAVRYALVTLVALTAVVAFDAVGSVLVVALMVTPAATAYLLTNRLAVFIALSVGIGVAGAVLGAVPAFWFDWNLPGAVAVALGVIFAIVMLATIYLKRSPRPAHCA